MAGADVGERVGFVGLDSLLFELEQVWALSAGCRGSGRRSFLLLLGLGTLDKR